MLHILPAIYLQNMTGDDTGETRVLSLECHNNIVANDQNLQMAYRNKIITNPQTGNHITFLQTSTDTDGRLLEMEATYDPHSNEPVAHYHPYQVEDFTILFGELTVKMDGQLKILKEGDTLHMPVNKVHAMWNVTDNKAVVNWKVRPALGTEYLLETSSGLSLDGKTKNGMPNILQIASMANKFSREFRLTRPPYIIQKIVFIILTPFAWLFGYRATYKKYIDWPASETDTFSVIHAR